MDREVSTALEEELKKKGIAVYCNASVKEIQEKDVYKRQIQESLIIYLLWRIKNLYKGLWGRGTDCGGGKKWFLPGEKLVEK